MTERPAGAGRFVARIDKAVAGTAITNVACAVLGSAGGLLLARLLGAGSRGDLAIAIAWPTFAAWLFAFGLPQALCFLTARRPSEAAEFLAASTMLSACLGAAAAALGWVFASRISHNPIVVGAMREMFLAVPIYLLAGLWTAAIQAVNVRLWNFARMVQPVLYLIAILGLGTTGNLTVASAVRGLVMSLIGAALFSGVSVYVLSGISRPRRNALSPMINYGLKSALAGAPSLVTVRVDQLILSLTVSSAALGQYVLAASLTYLAFPISTAFGSVAFPRIARLRDQFDARMEEKRALLGSVTTALLVLAPTALAAPFAVPFFFGADYRASVPLFLVLAPATVVLCFGKVAGDTLRGRGKPLVPAVAEGLGAVVTVILLVVLVPAFGVMGAAVASLIAYSTVAVLLLRGVLDPRQSPVTRYDVPEPEQLGPTEDIMLRKETL